MTGLRCAVCLVLAASAAGGCTLRGPEQSEVQSARVPGGTLEQRQRQTGAAYRRLEQARYEKRLAEQDYLNAKAAHDRIKREFDAASKAYADARAREKSAEHEYERGLRAVDELYGGAGSEPRPR